MLKSTVVLVLLSLLFAALLCSGVSTDQFPNSPCNLTNDSIPVVVQFAKEHYDNVSEGSLCGKESEDLPQCCECDNEIVCTNLDNAIHLLHNSIGQTERWMVLISLGSEDVSTSYMLEDVHMLDGAGSLAVRIQGQPGTKVTFGVRGAFTLHGMLSVGIDNICWDMGGNNRAVYHNTTSLTLSDCYNVTVTDSVFMDSYGTAVMLTQSDARQEVPNSNQCASILFRNSTFISNGYFNDDEKGTMKVVAQSLGGALALHMTVNTIMTFQGCTFQQNTAEYGGAVYIDVSGVPSYKECGAYTEFEDCTFAGNFARNDGGAVYINGLQTKFLNCSFRNNGAEGIGGAGYLTFHEQASIDGEMVIFLLNNCLLVSNYARGSSALILVSENNLNPLLSNYTAHLENTTIMSNIATVYTFFGQSPCSVVAERMPLLLKNVEFIYNCASALCLLESILNVEGVVTFSDNVGYQGGAVHFQNSQIRMWPSARLTFANNTAVQGGALYQYGEMIDKLCLINLYFTPTDTPSQVEFKRNFAYEKGSAIFFEDPLSSCADIFLNSFPKIVFDEEPPITLLASTALRFDFDPLQYVNENLSVNLSLGQKFSMNLGIFDYFNNSATDSATIILTPADDILHLQGFQSATLEMGDNTLDLVLLGPELLQNETLTRYSLNFHTFSNYTFAFNLVVNPCPTGFIYNETSESCKCADFNSIQCEISSFTACILHGYWVGEESGVYASSACSSQLCVNIDNCAPCSLTGALGFCQLPQNSSEQCTKNRGGFLCAECASGFLPTFANIMCVSETSCQSGKSAVALLLSFVFILFLLAGLAGLLKLHHRHSIAYLFGITYYFSIIEYLLPVSIGKELFVLLSVFQSITQLQPFFLGYIPICFARGASIIEQQVFVYVNPLFVSLVLLGIIAFGRYCSKIAIFKGNIPLKAICVLILFSFTSLTVTSFNILNPVMIEGMNGSFVFIQPTVPYLSDEHLPWFILAAATLVFIVVPFTVFLLVAPCINRCCNLTRIKPFLDEFQGCYKDKYRWMAGFYFLCRILYISLLTHSSFSPTLLQYLLQFMALGILMFHTYLQPYSNKWLNTLDFILLADILVITLLYGRTANDVFQSKMGIRLTLTYILIIIPVVYFVIISIAAIWFNSSTLKKISKKAMKKIRSVRSITTPSMSANDAKSHAVHVEHVSTSSFELSRSHCAYREPLLAGMDENLDASSSTENDSPLLDRSKSRAELLVRIN